MDSANLKPPAPKAGRRSSPAARPSPSGPPGAGAGAPGFMRPPPRSEAPAPARSEAPARGEAPTPRSGAPAAPARSEGPASTEPARPSAAPAQPAGGAAPAQAAGGAAPVASAPAGADAGPTSWGGAAASAEAVSASPTGVAAAPSVAGPAAEAAAPAGGGGGAPAAGPAAGSAEIQAEGGGVTIPLLMPEPPEGLNPESEARLQTAVELNQTSGTLTADVPPAEQSTSDARAAVVEPVDQLQAEASGAVVAAFDDRPAPSPDIEAFCAHVQQVIRDKRPADEDELVHADPDAAAAEAGAHVQGQVQGGVDGAQQSYDGVQEQPEPGAPNEATPTTPTPEAVETPAIDAAGAAPEPLPEESTDLGADVENADAQMDEAGMNTEPAQLVESGPIADARGARGELDETATREREAMLQRQQEAITHAQADMSELQARAQQALATARTANATAGNTQQGLMVGSEEQVRASVGQEANRIYTEAQSQVRTLLEPLGTNASARWDAEIVPIKNQFRADLREVEAAIEERHSGLGGAVVSLWDAVAGLPDWVVQAYDRAESNFADSVCDLIRDISRDVNAVIASCEGLITSARGRIDDLFAQLPANLQGWAAEQQTAFADRFATLQTEVQTAQHDIEQGLTQRAGEAVDEVRREVQALREAAGGLLGKIAAAINAFLDDPARFIINGLLQLLGISPASFWALVDRIGEVIDAIADDPIGFASNLAAALKQGFEQFFDNFPTHVLNGLVQWLFSGMGSVGVQIPSDFSLKSMMTFFLELMGITWDRVRRLLAKHIGEENIALIERAWSIVSTLIERGPEGIFEMIKDMLDPQNILDMVLQAAVDFLIERVVTAVATRIIGMLNPAGAILQAIEAIYRIIKWVFDNAAQIFTLVETVVNGAAELVSGNIAGMANAVEGALARIIPPVIDFLAGFLGFGDLPDRIADVIKGFQGQVERVMDRVIGWLASQGRRLLAAVGVGGDRDAPPREGDREGELGETVPFAGGHRLWIDTTRGGARVMMASTPSTVETFLLSQEVTNAADTDAKRAIVAEARTLAATAKVDADRVITAMHSPNPPASIEAADDSVEGKEHRLATMLQQVFQMMTGDQQLAVSKRAEHEHVEEYRRRTIRLKSRTNASNGALLDKLAADFTEEEAYIDIADTMEDLEGVKQTIRGLKDQVEAWERTLQANDNGEPEALGSVVSHLREELARNPDYDDHGKKHFDGPLSGRRQKAISSGEGQYNMEHPQVKAIEEAVLREASNGSHNLQDRSGGTLYVYARRPNIGFVGRTGANNTIIRVELSSRTVHSHPE